MDGFGLPARLYNEILEMGRRLVPSPTPGTSVVSTPGGTSVVPQDDSTIVGRLVAHLGGGRYSWCRCERTPTGWSPVAGSPLMECDLVSGEEDLAGKNAPIRRDGGTWYASFRRSGVGGPPPDCDAATLAVTVYGLSSGSPPLAGAAVSLLRDGVEIASCTTGPDGVCTINLDAAGELDNLPGAYTITVERYCYLAESKAVTLACGANGEAFYLEFDPDCGIPCVGCPERAGDVFTGTFTLVGTRWGPWNGATGTYSSAAPATLGGPTGYQPRAAGTFGETCSTSSTWRIAEISFGACLESVRAVLQCFDGFFTTTGNLFGCPGPLPATSVGPLVCPPHPIPCKSQPGTHTYTISVDAQVVLTLDGPPDGGGMMMMMAPSSGPSAAAPSAAEAFRAERAKVACDYRIPLARLSDEGSEGYREAGCGCSAVCLAGRSTRPDNLVGAECRDCPLAGPAH